jgi:hypothetical protein
MGRKKKTSLYVTPELKLGRKVEVNWVRGREKNS